MKYKEAIKIVLDLAEQNIIDEREPEMEEESKKQELAYKVVDEHTDHNAELLEALKEEVSFLWDVHSRVLAIEVELQNSIEDRIKEIEKAIPQSTK